MSFDKTISSDVSTINDVNIIDEIVIDNTNESIIKLIFESSTFVSNETT